MSDKDVSASTLQEFNPPANLTDFNAATKEAWSTNFVSYDMTGEINADDKVTGGGRTPLTQYFNGTVTAYNQSQPLTTVVWNAFPKLVTTATGGQEPLRWQIADFSRGVQDEYLEWSVHRDGPNGGYSGNILSVSLTCEGPEYWTYLASYQPNDMFQLMKTLNPYQSSQMAIGDFFNVDPKTQNQTYNPANPWNFKTTGGSIAHLIHPSNTLGAEIDIAAQATVIRKDASGKIITDPNQLINCSQYGNPGRNSDPQIGGGVNALARGDGEPQPQSVMVADPVALYIQEFDTSVYMYDVSDTNVEPAPPANLKPITNLDQVFNLQRGTITAQVKQGLRYCVSVPQGVVSNSGRQLTVSDIYDTKAQVHISYGAQFADQITMGVSVVTINGTEAAPLACIGASMAAANGTKKTVLKKKAHRGR